MSLSRRLVGTSASLVLGRRRWPSAEHRTSSPPARLGLLSERPTGREAGHSHVPTRRKGALGRVHDWLADMCVHACPCGVDLDPGNGAPGDICERVG